MKPKMPWTVVVHYPFPMGYGNDDWPFYVGLVEVEQSDDYTEAKAALKKVQAEVAKRWRKDLKAHGRTEHLPNPCDFKMVFCSRGRVNVEYFGFQAEFAE